MTGPIDEIKRYPVVWLPLLVGTGMLYLVNQTELVFARSLIHCNEPINPDPKALFSGSARCGDRLEVIKEGQMLSSVGQSQESIAKIAMMFLAAILNDVYGRKPMVVLGLSLTAASILCFLSACFMHDWARVLFAMGQGLQGAFPTEMLAATVAADMATKEDTESTSCFEVANAIPFLCGTLFFPVAILLQYLELTNYFPIWLFILSLNTVAAVAAFMYMPETRPGGVDKERAKEGVLSAVAKEVQGYATFIKSDEIVRVVMLAFCCECMAMATQPMWQSLAGAYFGVSVAFVNLALVPMVIIGGLAMPLVPAVHKKFGYKKGVAYCLGALFVGLMMQWTMPLHPVFFFGNVYWLCLFSGFGGVKQAYEAKLFGENIGKFIALNSILTFGLTIIAGPMYAWIFNPKSTGYVGLAAPVLVGMLFRAGQITILAHPWTGIWKKMCTAFVVMEKERDEFNKKEAEEKAKKSAEEEAEKDKTIEEKKGD